MTDAAPGWYADPSEHNLDGRALRYWDGQTWTEHVHHPGPYYPVPLVATTPDGVPLAGWWQRVLAQTIDGFILTPLIALAVTPLVISQWDDIKDWFDTVADPNRTSSPTFGRDVPDILNPFSGPGAAAFGLVLAVSLAYQLVFLHWKQATPGKLVVGLRIRLRDAPGLPWRAIAPRVAFVLGISLLGSIPYLGALVSIAGLLDYLWPLWDDKRQALHDKVARTNVVNVR